MSRRTASHLALATAMSGIAGLRSFHFDPAGTAAPPSDRFKAQREEFTRLQGEARQVIDAAAAENRELKDDEKKENEKRFARLRAIKAVMDEDARFAAMAIGAAPGNAPGHVQRPQDPAGRGELEQHDGLTRATFNGWPGENEQDAFRRHRDAVNNFIRTGTVRGAYAAGIGPAAAEALKFALTTGSGTNALLPTVVAPPVVLKRIRNPIRAALVARGLNVIRTEGMELMTVPVFDDTANVGFTIAQDSTAENNADPTVTSLSLGADLLDSGTVWLSNTLLATTSYDLLGYIEPMLDARITARELATWMPDLRATANIYTMTAAAGNVTTVGDWVELVNWQHSMPLTRRADGVFFVSDGLLKVLRSMKDGDGRPIYQESLRDDAPDRLLGWPVFVTTGLDAPAANAISGVAVSAESIVVRDVTGAGGGRRIARYTNIPTHPDQFGIRLFQNSDFAFHAAGAWALRHPAT